MNIPDRGYKPRPAKVLFPMRIRPAKTSDIDELSELTMLSKQSNGYDESFMEQCRDELRVTEARLKDGEVWVAEANVLCGYACLNVDPDGVSGEVNAFFVHPDWKRQGVGKKLWGKILQRATDQNLERLHLDADPFAVPFYNSIGFKTTRETPSGSIPGRMLPYMELHISKPNT